MNTVQTENYYSSERLRHLRCLQLASIRYAFNLNDPTLIVTLLRQIPEEYQKSNLLFSPSLLCLPEPSKQNCIARTGVIDFGFSFCLPYDAIQDTLIRLIEGHSIWCNTAAFDVVLKKTVDGLIANYVRSAAERYEVLAGSMVIADGQDHEKTLYNGKDDDNTAVHCTTNEPLFLASRIKFSINLTAGVDRPRPPTAAALASSNQQAQAASIGLPIHQQSILGGKRFHDMLPIDNESFETHAKPLLVKDTEYQSNAPEPIGDGRFRDYDALLDPDIFLSLPDDEIDQILVDFGINPDQSKYLNKIYDLLDQYADDDLPQAKESTAADFEPDASALRLIQSWLGPEYDLGNIAPLTPRSLADIVETCRAEMHHSYDLDDHPCYGLFFHVAFYWAAAAIENEFKANGKSTEVNVWQMYIDNLKKRAHAALCSDYQANTEIWHNVKRNIHHVDAWFTELAKFPLKSHALNTLSGLFSCGAYRSKGAVDKHLPTLAVLHSIFLALHEQGVDVAYCEYQPNNLCYKEHQLADTVGNWQARQSVLYLQIAETYLEQCRHHGLEDTAVFVEASDLPIALKHCLFAAFSDNRIVVFGVTRAHREAVNLAAASATKAGLIVCKNRVARLSHLAEGIGCKIDQADLPLHRHYDATLVELLGQASAGWTFRPHQDAQVLSSLLDGLENMPVVKADDRQHEAVAAQALADIFGPHATASWNNTEARRFLISLAEKVISKRVQNKHLLPAEVKSFLYDCWAQVLIHCKLSPESPLVWEEAIACMDRLIWSSTPPADEADTQAIARGWPGLVKRLHEGMAPVMSDFELSKALRTLEAANRRYANQFRVAHCDCASGNAVINVGGIQSYVLLVGS